MELQWALDKLVLDKIMCCLFITRSKEERSVKKQKNCEATEYLKQKIKELKLCRVSVFAE